MYMYLTHCTPNLTNKTFNYQNIEKCTSNEILKLIMIFQICVLVKLIKY